MSFVVDEKEKLEQVKNLIVICGVRHRKLKKEGIFLKKSPPFCMMNC